jgi:hypothetical protein
MSEGINGQVYAEAASTGAVISGGSQGEQRDRDLGNHDDRTTALAPMRAKV